MNQIETTEVELKEEETKKKLITTYRIPMVGGAYFYGVASPDGGTVAPADGGGGGE